MDWAAGCNDLVITVVGVTRITTVAVAEEDFLFTDPKTGTKPVKTDLVNRYFKKVCLTSHTTYDLRHTNASILIYSGLNIVEVANRLGNSVDVCQKVYLHMLNKVEDINLSREDEFLKNAVKPLKFETYEIGINYWEPPIPKN
jgi:integrase